jgi:hydrogenase expression/formation protein HypD
MKFIDEYRDPVKVRALADDIKAVSKKPLRLMEVCGGHTHAIFQFGIHDLLPKTIELLSGPGCPVCVTDKKFIDQAVTYAQMPDVIICTFGDLIRVPGSQRTLARVQAEGANVQIIYSPLTCLDIARQNPDKKIVFLGIGFETTAPTTAATIVEAKKQNITNFFVLSGHKIMPPAMAALIDKGVRIDGYICPGHVSTITGSHMYEPIAAKYQVGCVIAGFEPTDILESILMLVKQLETNQPKVEIQYTRSVSEAGNVKAQQLLSEVFELHDDAWRGLGILPLSGLGIAKAFSYFVAEVQIPITPPQTIEEPGCICGEILKGVKPPHDCPLFGKACTPSQPIGACMVSSEGACAAYYRYNRKHD